MTAITEGNTYQTTLGASESLFIKTDGTATVSYGRRLDNSASVDTVTSSDAEREYGPYNVPMQIKVEAVTSSAYYNNEFTQLTKTSDSKSDSDAIDKLVDTFKDKTGGMTPEEIGNAIKKPGNNAYTALPRYSQTLLSAAAGDIVRFKAAAFIDSIGLFPWQTIGPIVSAAIGSDYPMAPQNGESVNGSDVSAINVGLYLNNPTSGTVTQLTNQFDRWFTGDIKSLSSGTEVELLKSGSSPTFSTVKVAYLIKSGGGTIQLKVDGSLVGSAIDTSSGTPSEIGFISHSQTYAKKTVAIVTSGGDVEVVYQWIESNDSNRVELHDLNKGGLSLEDALGSERSQSNLAALVEEIDLDLITYEGKENSSYLASEFSKLCDIFDSSASNADKIICGSTPTPLSEISNTDQLAQNDILYNEVVLRGNAGLPYRYADKYAPFVRGNDPSSAIEFLLDLGSDFYGDGIHFSQLGTEVANSQISQMFALSSSVYAKQLQPVWNRSDKSMLAPGTFFSGPNGNEISFTTDASFGFDWDLNIPRSFSIESTLGDVNFRLSSQPGSVSNVIPSSFDIGTAGSEIKASLSSVNGFKAWVFTDSNKAGASGNCFFRLINVPPVVYRADLLGGDYPANTMPGAMVRVPDGAAGDGVYMAVGGSPSDWQKISTSGAV